MNNKILGIILGPVLCALIILMPQIPGLEPIGQKAIAGAVWIITWWMFQPFHLAVTSLWAIIIFSFLGVMTPNDAFKQISQPAILLFLGATLILGVWNESNLIKRYAYSMLNLKFVKSKSSRVIITFAFASALLSSFVANIPIAMLFLAIGLAMINETGIKKGSSFGRGLVMMSGIAPSIGGIGSPIGGAPNIIVVGLIASILKINVEFWQWSIIGIPIVIVSMIPALFILFKMYPLSEEEKSLPVAGDFIKEELKEMGPISLYEKIAFFALSIALFLWLFAGPITKAMGLIFLSKLLKTPFIALLVGACLFLIPIKKEGPVFAMNWEQGLRSINWSIILFIMGSGILGTALNTTGVDKWLASLINSFTGSISGMWVILIIIILTAFLTQVITNLAVISLMVPVVISLAPMYGLDPVLCSLLVGMTANNGLVFPFSSITVSVAVLGAKGYADVKDFFKYGLIAIVAGALVVFSVGMLIGQFVF